MTLRATHWAWFVFAAALSAAVIFVTQARRDAARRALTLATARHQHLEFLELQERHLQLAASQLSAEEISALRRRHAEIEAVRLRLAALQQRVKGAEDSDPAVGQAHERVPADAWIYAGRDSPQAAFESVLWAAYHGDVDRLAELLTFSEEDRARAEVLFSQLPAASQQEYGTPRKVVATLLAGSFPENASAMVALGDSEYGGNAELYMRVEHSDGQAKDSLFALQRAEDGWRLFVPHSMMANYEKMLTGVQRP